MTQVDDNDSTEFDAVATWMDAEARRYACAALGQDAAGSPVEQADRLRQALESDGERLLAVLRPENLVATLRAWWFQWDGRRTHLLGLREASLDEQRDELVAVDLADQLCVRPEQRLAVAHELAPEVASPSAATASRSSAPSWRDRHRLDPDDPPTAPPGRPRRKCAYRVDCQIPTERGCRLRLGTRARDLAPALWSRGEDGRYHSRQGTTGWRSRRRSGPALPAS